MMLTKQQIDDLLTRCKGHTPGPWGLMKDGPNYRIFGAKRPLRKEVYILFVAGKSCEGEPSTFANATLARAAPALLATVQQLQSQQEVFSEAVAGDEEPALWLVSWTESVLNMVDHLLMDQANGDADSIIARLAEDPQSLNEANRYAMDMCKKLRTALASVKGEENV